MTTINFNKIRRYSLGESTKQFDMVLCVIERIVRSVVCRSLIRSSHQGTSQKISQISNWRTIFLLCSHQALFAANFLFFFIFFFFYMFPEGCLQQPGNVQLFSQKTSLDSVNCPVVICSHHEDLIKCYIKTCFSVCGRKSQCLSFRDFNKTRDVFVSFLDRGQTHFLVTISISQ